MSQGASERDRGGVAVRVLADLVGGRVEGDPTVEVRALRPLDEAGPTELGLLTSKRYARFAKTTRAAAVLVDETLADGVPGGLTKVVVSDAHAAVTTVLERLHPPAPNPEPGIHPTAILGRGARLGEAVCVGPYAVLGDDVDVGDGTRIDAHVVIGSGVRIGEGCHICPQVVVYPGSELGDRVLVHAGARIGSDGFGYTFRDGAHRKVPQVGRCVIGDDVEIGANTTIDRGSIGDTVIGTGVKVDNLVQIAHNVNVGEHSLMAALVGIAGSTRLGRGVWLGGQAGLVGHLDVGDGARVAVASKVYRDIPAGETVSGHPARPHREELRKQAHVARLPKLLERIEALEEEVARLRAGLSGPDTAAPGEAEKRDPEG
jgi:UDP-3-O-[3-hydroxymyristoyl] glucosamine N-acyltransferase